MQILRHEEFSDGCKAQCNGMFDGMWSKTMVGFGDESDSFVLEIVYNYGIKSYVKGNTLKSLTFTIPVQNKIQFPHLFNDMYLFERSCERVSSGSSISKLSLNVSKIDNKTYNLWCKLLDFKVLENSNMHVVFVASDKNEWQLNLHVLENEKVNLGNNNGRLAVSCPLSVLEEKQRQALSLGINVLRPMIKLDTDEKQSVTVFIITDDDGNEICIVDEDNFSLLSQRDTDASAKLHIVTGTF
ncbi:hypothetical protein GJ496_007612 [Pomphorhynchus laevis]|nr:hypothetical protein GJ496_007612 [Pomphorhynchus laevis]